MSSAYGISTEGFRKKRLSDIKTEVENSLKTIFGNNINLISTSVFSNLIGVFSERESLLWELAEQVYFSQYKNSAQGINLDNVMQLINVTRLNQTKTLQKEQHLFGDIGTVVPAGTKFSVIGSPTSVFETLNDVTLVAGVDEVQSLTVPAAPISGSFRLKYQNEETAVLLFSASAADIQTALNNLSKLDGVTVVGTWAGGFTVTFAGNSGKINHELLQVVSSTLNQTLSVAQVTAGVPQGVVDAQCTLFGEIVAPSFSLTQIDTPVVGLDRVTNPTDAVVGRSTETDNELRIRSLVAQLSSGKTTVEAIRAKLLEVSGVTQAIVFQNESLLVDGNGLPAKSFRAYVQGGDNQDIFQCLWDNKPAGIKSDGAVAGTVIDSQGLTQNLAFTRPVVKNVYITIRVTRDVARFPVNGSDLVRDALASFVNALEIGQDVIVYPQLISSLNSIVGVLDIEIGVAFTPAPALGTDANLPIAINEIAKVSNSLTDIGITLI